jgi:crotonobetainyl-CoA:carnitine CoA-transferase CaiB-like acyl-CoA transferase
MSTRPLANVRILSLAEQYPGPYATMILADLGADVILVERPGSGDPSRRFPGLFASLNRNKRSVVLDLKSPAGYEAFLRLVDDADVVIEGFRPGVMARLKLGPDQLRARKPGLVFASISSFGQSGPRSAVAGHDLSIQGAVGMLDVEPGREEEAVLPALPMADIASAMFAALGVVTALLARSRSGSGAEIDVSMMDCLLSWMTPFLVPPLNGLPTRELPPPDPSYGLFATADGRQITLSISGEDHMWSALCGLLGLQDLAALPEEERLRRNKQIQRQLRDAIRREPYDSLYRRLDEAGIAFGPVPQLDAVLSDPQVLARRMAVAVKGNAGTQAFLRQPLIFDRQVGTIERGVPALGEHNAEVIGRRPGAET